MNADEILGLDDLVKESIVVPEWGNKTFIVRTMTAAERDQFEQREQERRERTGSLAGLRARLIIETLENEDGSRVFGRQHADQLARKSAKILGRIFDVSARLNGMTKQDVDALVKNSETDLDAAGS